MPHTEPPPPPPPWMWRHREDGGPTTPPPDPASDQKPGSLDLAVTRATGELSKNTGAINLIPSIADLFFCVIFLSLTFFGGSGLLGDGDTGYHIRAGEYMFKTLSVPKSDIFSFHTPPLPWTAHEWLSEVVMAAVHGLFGLAGIVAFFAFLLACTIALLFKTLKSHGASLLIATGLTLLASCASQIHWLARPHVFSLLFMITWHRLLETWQRGGVARLYLLPLTMLLWVNLHGGFLGGFLLLGAYLAGNLFYLITLPLPARPGQVTKLRQLCGTIGCCLLACLCNPSGYQILLFPFKLVSNRYLMDHVSEFLSPNFHEFLPFKYLLLLLIATLAVSKKSVDATELALMLIFTNMALYSTRYIPLFALIVAPILTRQSVQTKTESTGKLAVFFRERSRNIALLDHSATGYLWPAAALLVVTVALGSGRLHQGFDAKTKPVAAVEFLLKEQMPGNMFNDDEFGDYLIYRTFPRYRVFFDGRSDMYGTGKLKEYSKVINFESGWEQILDKYRITWVFYGTSSNLSRYLLHEKRWVLIYSDKVASIFVRDLPQYRHLIQKYHSVQLSRAEPGA
jgi:hypothetical protein